jgi:hypothetical protein
VTRTITRLDIGVVPAVERRPSLDPQRSFQPKDLCNQQAGWAASQLARFLGLV